MLRRHDLLRVDPSAWDAILQRDAELAEVPMMADWARLGRPVIVRRRMPGDDPDTVPAALSLPPSHGKRRIALGVSPDAVLAVPPVLLRDAAPAAPAAWQTVIGALVGFGEAARAEPAVFGALMWEHLTGMGYLTSRSDLDLLWRVSDELLARSVVRALLRLDALPVRLDGELMLADGAAVSWRELAQTDHRPSDVLARTSDGVELRPRGVLFRMPSP